MNCQTCEWDMGDARDKTYSNTGRDLGRVDPNHTGDIYYCECCEQWYLDNFITGQVEIWKG